MAGFLGGDKINGSLFRRLRKLNDGGWNYVDKIINKSNAIGMSEYEAKKVNDDDLTPLIYDLPGVYRSQEDITYDKLQSIYSKNEYLGDIAAFDEIDFVLTTISDETIIYDEDGIFATPNISKLMTKFSLKETIIKEIEDIYNKIYFLFRFNDNDYGWRLFREWMIYGRIAFEILYSDTKKSIIGFKRLDPYSLQMKIQKVGGKYIKYWVQYEGNAQLERQLADDEIIYISYNDTKNRTSYLETIIRSFNVMRTLEDTRVIWGVMHSVLRMKMIVPINTKSEQRAKIKVGELRNAYKESINIDKVSGQITVNGKTNLPLFKNYIFPSKDGEQIEIEPVTHSFNDVISTDEMEYFSRKFKISSKIPFSRFEYGGTGTYDLSISIETEEIRFAKFISRLRNIFKDILLKPFKIQLKLDYPELTEDLYLWNTININFNKNNLFEELKELEIMERRADFISSMNNVVVKKWDNETSDFVEESFFSSRYLVEKYMRLTGDEIRKNQDYKQKFGEVKPEVDETDPDLELSI